MLLPGRSTALVRVALPRMAVSVSLCLQVLYGVLYGGTLRSRDSWRAAREIEAAEG